MSLTWEEKLHKTEQKQEDRRQALERMGISVQSSGIKVIFQFFNLNPTIGAVGEILLFWGSFNANSCQQKIFL
jgi:hypothetical protein